MTEPVPAAAALNVETLLLEKEQLQKKVDELTQQLADVTAPRYMQEAAEAFAFQKLCQHLQQRLDAQNIDMMILAGFCRNCLCKWYHVGAATFGLGLTYEQSCEKVYGMPYATWKKEHQGKATEDQLRRLEESKPGHAKHEPPPEEPLDFGPLPADHSKNKLPAAPSGPPPAAPPLSDVCCTPADELAAQALAQNGGGPACALPTAPAAHVWGPPPPPAAPVDISLGVLTISDRASAGEYDDLSGPEIVNCMSEYAEKAGGGGWRLAVKERAVVPDEEAQISAKLREWSSGGGCSLVLTTGGTGLAPRDVTPEATAAVLTRETPGVTELLLRESMKIEPLAALSRATSGVAGRTLIINLPGRPHAVRQNLNILMPVLSHALLGIEERIEEGVEGWG